MRDFLFTSESVSEGHPDKICDQISDAILDAYLQKDPQSRVACEVLVAEDFACIAGEVTSQAEVDPVSIAKNVIRKIGYVDPELGFSADTVRIEQHIHQQSMDISQGVTLGEGLHKGQGAGDQGMVFGYASDETPEYMPLSISIAHQILQHMSSLRSKGELHGILPDSKSQVTVEYRDGKPFRLDTVVLSTQHEESLSHKNLTELLMEKVLQPLLPANLVKDTSYLINPTGRFVIGGPKGDTGLTGRKIIVDTYGGWGRHGGGAFSGKDPTKVDRSGAYMARYCAKNIVAAGLAKRCELQVAYAIGYPDPVSLHIESFGTETVPLEKIRQRVEDCFRFSSSSISESLGLRDKGRNYNDTAVYGHFGRKGETFTWEKTDRVEQLLS